MYTSEKNSLAAQIFHQTKQKKKAAKPKPVYRELLENEKSLLNFQFSDYHDHEHHHDYRAPKLSKALSYMDKRQLKQNYLQGNFRFLVNPDYEESITYVDPDQEIKWRTIEKVKYIVNNMIACPICLNDHYDVIFPKITRCGHIFCWPCITKYLSYEKTKCPLCEDFLMKEDLRSVQIIHYHLPNPKEKIFLKLKKRRKTENTVYDANDLNEDEEFMRIKRMSWNEILKFREEETQELVNHLNRLEYEEDKDIKPFVEQCLQIQGSNIEKIQKLTVQTKHKKSKDNEEFKENEAAFEEEFLYFYQEMNGLNVFLHPIDNKYIKLQYQDTKDLPPVIEAPVIEIRSFQQTDLTQRRYKFLNHLPLSSNINFVELELKDFLTADIYKQLEDEMITYKQVSAPLTINKKKESTEINFIQESNDPLTPKNITRPNESKYNIQFPIEPSELKLNDINDYPELGGGNKNAEKDDKNDWSKPMPSRKKGSKKNTNANNQQKGFKENFLRIGDDVENKIFEVPKLRTSLSEQPPEEMWKTVKVDKAFLRNYKD